MPEAAASAALSTRKRKTGRIRPVFRLRAYKKLARCSDTSGLELVEKK
jgi:hypothetical protein